VQSQESSSVLVGLGPTGDLHLIPKSALPVPVSFSAHWIAFLLLVQVCAMSLIGHGQESARDHLLIFISDMHLGVGKTSEAKWHNYEDARWAPEFDLFLKEMNRQGKGKAELILNGDTFELWQSLEEDCRYRNTNLGCTAAYSLSRLARSAGR